MHVLVNNAGITRDGLVFRMPTADWDAVLRANLTSAFFTCRLVARAMVKQRAGSIVNIASVSGIMGNAGQTNYAASKAGLIGFSKSLAREVATRGVRVNVIAPGFIETDMTRGLGEKVREAFLAQIPLGRMGIGRGGRRAGGVPRLGPLVLRHGAGDPRRRRAFDVTVEGDTMGRRVVVTGLGTVNPLGNNVQDSWRRIRAGENGIGRITRFDVSDYPSKIAGELKDFAPEKVMESKDARRMDRFTQYAMVAGIEAMAQAGLASGQVDPERFAVVIGNGIGGVETLENSLRKLVERGPKAVEPLFVPMMIMNEVAGNIAIRFQAHGPCFCVVTACASSNDAMGDAWRLIREGRVDVAIAGGTEAGVTPLSLAGFCRLQALSTQRNDDPARASRPFDRDRDGFVMAEGAGILVLEELEHARRRGATVLAELAGYGSSCDANHLTAPHPEGRGAIQAINAALASAGLAPGDVDYVNAHGTSTPINDPIETKAIKAVFGDHARKLQGVLDQVHARAPARRRGRHRGGGDGHGDPRPVLPADAQPREPRPGLRPGLRAEHGRARAASGPPSRTRSASAGTTRWCCSGSSVA